MKVKELLVETNKTSTIQIVWSYEKDDRQQTTEVDVLMDAKRMEEKSKIQTKSKLDTCYCLSNERTKIGGWFLPRQS